MIIQNLVLYGKTIIVILFSMISLSSFAFSFKFNLLGFDINVKNYCTYRAWSDGTYAKSCNEYKNPTQSNKKYSGNLPTTISSGIFRIKPTSEPAFDVTCDMLNSGGGWTRLNASSAQSEVSSFASDGGLSGYNHINFSEANQNANFRIKNIKINFNNVRVDFRRTSTLMQCASINFNSNIQPSNFLTKSYYYSNDTTQNEVTTTCTWGLYPWAGPDGPSSVTTTYGVLDWRIYYYNVNLGNTGYFSFVSFANYAADTGNYSAYVYVK